MDWEYKYQIGQNVYTVRDLRGWFDKSVKDHIPAGTMGAVLNRRHGWDDNEYDIAFLGENEEFGTFVIAEHDLTLK